jgi:glycosyltransferase involved in cell wall biosynthesis
MQPGVFPAATKTTTAVRVVSHVHGCPRSAHMPTTLRFGDAALGYSRKENWYRYFREKVLWSRADRVLAVSGSVKSDMASSSGIPSARVDVVYDGVDTSIFRPLPSSCFPVQQERSQSERIVLYVGHFGLRKGVLFLIRTMKAVAKQVPDAVLACMGWVPKWLGARLLALIRALHRRERPRRASSSTGQGTERETPETPLCRRSVRPPFLP